MKKTICMISVLLCVALMLSIIPLSYAETTEDGTDFRQILEAGEQSAGTVKIVTDAKFYCDQIDEFCGDYAIFRDIVTGNRGIVDYHGKIVYNKEYPSPSRIICENVFFGEVNNGYKLFDFQGNLIEAFKDVTVNVTSSANLWMDSETGEPLGLLLYPNDTYSMFYSNGTMYSSLAAFDGRRMGDPNDRDSLYSLPVDGKVVTFSMGVGFGLSELFGDEILPMEYSMLIFMDKDRLLARKNGVYQFIRPDGTVLKELPYDQIKQIMAAKRIFRVEQNGKYGVISEDGEILIPIEYDSIEVYDGKDFVLGTVGTEQMLISLDPNMTFCGSRQFPLNTRVIVSDCYLIQDGESSYLVNSQNERLIPESVSTAEMLKNSLVVALQDREIVRLYDEEMNVLSEISGTYNGLVSDESVLVCRADESGINTIEFYNSIGELVNSVHDADSVSVGENYVQINKNGKYALGDPFGRQLTDFLYAFFEPFETIPKNYTSYCCGYRSSDGKGVLLDYKTGKYALSESATIGFLMPIAPGGYFPFYEGEKLGFAKVTTPEESPFRDVPETSWYKEAAKFCFNSGLMAGTGNSYFSPKATTTRAMLVQILYKLSGEKTESYGFADVPDGKWYSDAVNWAANSGIVSGKTASTFGPKDSLSRQQLVAILYKYACMFGQKEADPTVLERFEDADTISEYAVNAMAWAVENGLVSGKTATTLVPKGTATRAEIAVILMGFVRYMAAEQAASK
ncbi:MAG: S-layer homology domain-containing protein [Oscillospiraceae bacterium]|nr:S-layer homology domain-containing protein [Oscillospiraceae bacterium]